MTVCYRYSLPTWADFEMGLATVYWETSNGLPPTSVSIATSYYCFNCMDVSRFYLFDVKNFCIGLVCLDRGHITMMFNVIYLWQGQLLTIYFNPSASELTPNTEYGIGFNGTPISNFVSLLYVLFCTFAFRCHRGSDQVWC